MYYSAKAGSRITRRRVRIPPRCAQRSPCAQLCADTLKINRGTLDGATFWYKGEGHRMRMKGPSDLVFVLRQTPHPRFERVGDVRRAHRASDPPWLRSTARGPNTRCLDPDPASRPDLPGSSR